MQEELSPAAKLEREKVRAESAAAMAKEEKLQVLEEVKREVMAGIMKDVHVVDEVEEAKRVCKLLMNQYKGCVFACDTEVCFRSVALMICMSIWRWVGRGGVLILILNGAPLHSWKASCESQQSVP